MTDVATVDFRPDATSFDAEVGVRIGNLDTFFADSERVLLWVDDDVFEASALPVFELRLVEQREGNREGRMTVDVVEAMARVVEQRCTFELT